MRILIIEDQVYLAATLRDILKKNHYDVDVVHDGVQGYESLMLNIYDGVILDVMLPGMNGFEILQNIRSRKNEIPVLLLTAKNDLEDKVFGLNRGADYYLTKPFENSELLACLRAITRRKGEVLTEQITFGDLTLDLKSYELSCAKVSIRLSKKEYDVIYLLMMNTNIVLPKETILTKLWGMESDAIDNNVEIYISFLRKKMKFLQSSVYIMTLRQLGYRLVYARD